MIPKIFFKNHSSSIATTCPDYSLCSCLTVTLTGFDPGYWGYDPNGTFHLKNLFPSTQYSGSGAVGQLIVFCSPGGSPSDPITWVISMWNGFLTEPAGFFPATANPCLPADGDIDPITGTTGHWAFSVASCCVNCSTLSFDDCTACATAHPSYSLTIAGGHGDCSVPDGTYTLNNIAPCGWSDLTAFDLVCGGGGGGAWELIDSSCTPVRYIVWPYCDGLGCPGAGTVVDSGTTYTLA